MDQNLYHLSLIGGVHLIINDEVFNVILSALHYGQLDAA